MRKSIVLGAAAAIAALGAGGAAQAQSYIDFNAGVTVFDDPDATALTGRLGVNFTPTWGAEGEISVGDDDLDTAYGLFGTGKLPITDQAELFGRVGYASADGNGGGDDGGIALGIGGVLMLDGRNGIRGDFTRYDFGDETTAFSLSYVRRLY